MTLDKPCHVAIPCHVSLTMPRVTSRNWHVTIFVF